MNCPFYWLVPFVRQISKFLLTFAHIIFLRRSFGRFLIAQFFSDDGFLVGEELLEIVSDMMRKVEIELTMQQLENLVEVRSPLISLA